MTTINVITYCLKDGDGDSEKYYRGITRFTASVMQVFEEQAGDLADDYMSFLKEHKPISKLLSRKEYLFEALLMGVYMREYGGYALGMAAPSIAVMRSLASLRKRGGVYKKFADRLRGRFGMAWLMKEKYRHRFLFPSARNLRRLIHWLDATAEFGQQAARLKSWHHFFRSLTEIECAIYLSVVAQLADWFTNMAEQALGEYTTQVSHFLVDVRSSYRNREDAISVYKSSVEYHLNMVGAVVINEAFGDQYQKTGKKVLLVPPCMRGIFASSCRSTKGRKGDSCAACSDLCAVNQLRRLGLQHDFEVAIMHHASKPPDWLRDPENNKNTGVIGAACPTNLVSGGWTIQALGIPAQCVVLDHCGCRHWHQQGIATTLSEKELLRRVKGNPLRQSRPGITLKNHELLFKTA